MRALQATAATVALLLSACTPSGGPSTDTAAPPAGTGVTNGPALGRNEYPTGASASGAAAVQSTQPQSRVFVDPVTGELRAPTAAELDAAAAPNAQSSSTRSAAALQAAPEVKVTPLPGGMTEYDVGDAGRVREQACVQPDGSVARCAPARAAAGNRVPGPRSP